MTTSNDNTPARPEPTAAQMYDAHRADIARLLDVLQMEMDKHAVKAKADERNWGFVGDLAKARKTLIDMVGDFSGMDMHTVEAFLDEAE